MAKRNAKEKKELKKTPIITKTATKKLEPVKVMPVILKTPEPEINILESGADDLRIEREKLLIMRTGITFFMVLIVGVWLFNVRNIIATSVPQKNNDDTFKKLTAQLDTNAKKASDIMSQLKQIASSSLSEKVTGTEEVSAGTSTEQQLFIDNLMKNIEGSEATSSATSSAHLPDIN